MKSPIFLVPLLLVAGCVASSRSVYRDPGEVRAPSTDMSSYDLQQCAAAMVDSMLSNPSLDRKLARQFPGETPTVSVLPIRNETYQPGLNLNSMMDSIRTRLIQSDKFEFVDRTEDARVAAELVLDQDSPLTDESRAVGFKTQAVAHYLLTGRLVEIVDPDRRQREVYYKLTLQLLNKRSGKVDWIDEKEIRKVGARLSR